MPPEQRGPTGARELQATAPTAPAAGLGMRRRSGVDVRRPLGHIIMPRVYVASLSEVKAELEVLWPPRGGPCNGGPGADSVALGVGNREGTGTAAGAPPRHTTKNVWMRDQPAKQ